MIILVKLKILMFKNRVKNLTYAEVLKAFGLGFISLMFMAFLYVGFIRLLTVVKNVEIIGNLLMLKLLSMAFLTTFVMVVFSSVLTSFSTMFFAHDLSFLIQMPLKFRYIFGFKTLETSVYASWMVVLAMVPFLFAYGYIYELGLSFYMLLVVLSVPFLAIASFLGILVALGLIKMFPSKRVREVVMLLGVILGGSLYVLFRWLEPEKLVRADNFEVVLQYIALIEAPTAPYLPSWWIASAVNSFVIKNYSDMFIYGGILLLVTVIFGFVLIALAEKFYGNSFRVF